MTHGIILSGSAAAGVVVAATSSLSHSGTMIVWAAGVLAALGVIYKAIHLGPAIRKAKDFARSWFGEPAAPGVEARPGLPETVAKMAAHIHEIKGRDATIAQFLQDISEKMTENGLKVDRIDERVLHLDERVTDHRRRNEEQATLLRADLERRARELENARLERDQVVDERFDHISDDLLRAETMRSALVELGLDIDRPQKPTK